MRCAYFPATGTLCSALRHGPSIDAAQVAPSVVLDHDREWHVSRVTVELAPARADLDLPRVSAIPSSKQPGA